MTAMARTCHSPQSELKVGWKSSSSGGGLFTERLATHLERGAFLLLHHFMLTRETPARIGPAFLLALLNSQKVRFVAASVRSCCCQCCCRNQCLIPRS